MSSEQDARASFSNSTPTEASAEAFKAIAAKYGVAPDATLGAHKITPAPIAREPAPVVVGRIDLSPTGQRDLSAQEQASGADMLTKFWTGDPAELRAKLEAAGMVEVNEADDTRSPVEQAFDGSYLAPAATVDDYHLNYTERQGVPLDELAAFDGEMKTAFAAASVPVALAQSVLDAILDSAEGYGSRAEGLAPEGKQPPTGLKQKSWWNEQRYALSQMGDPDQLMAQASVVFQRFPADTQAMLLEHHALDSALAIRRLAQVGELIVARIGVDAALTKRS